LVKGFYSSYTHFEFVREWGHYAFKVNEQQFDEIIERIKSENIVFGSVPRSVNDGKINHNYGG